MNVYATIESCTQRQVWIDAEYQNQGFEVDHADDPTIEDHFLYFSGLTRTDVVAECRSELSMTERQGRYHRDISRLILRALDEDTNS